MVQDYTAAIKLSSDNVRLYNNRAYCLAKVGLYQEAVADYDRVVQLEPGNTHALHNRGIRYETLLGSFRSERSGFCTLSRFVAVETYGRVGVVLPGVGELYPALSPQSRNIFPNAQPPFYVVPFCRSLIKIDMPRPLKEGLSLPHDTLSDADPFAAASTRWANSSAQFRTSRQVKDWNIVAIRKTRRSRDCTAISPVAIRAAHSSNAVRLSWQLGNSLPGFLVLLAKAGRHLSIRTLQCWQSTQGMPTRSSTAARLMTASGTSTGQLRTTLVRSRWTWHRAGELLDS